VFRAPHILVEALTGDFAGNLEHVERVARSGLDVYAHNVETTEAMTPFVRDRRATFQQSLAVLRAAKAAGVRVTKTSMMLGVGETEDGMYDALRQLRAADVDVVTFGQYMRPTKKHMKVDRYVEPAEFDAWRQRAEDMGFLYVASGPLVRSSYKVRVASSQVERDAADGCIAGGRVLHRECPPREGCGSAGGRQRCHGFAGGCPPQGVRIPAMLSVESGFMVVLIILYIHLSSAFATPGERYRSLSYVSVARLLQALDPLRDVADVVDRAFVVLSVPGSPLDLPVDVGQVGPQLHERGEHALDALLPLVVVRLKTCEKILVVFQQPFVPSHLLVELLQVRSRLARALGQLAENIVRDAHSVEELGQNRIADPVNAVSARVLREEQFCPVSGVGCCDALGCSAGVGYDAVGGLN
jgi:hypothetical protein